MEINERIRELYIQGKKGTEISNLLGIERNKVNHIIFDRLKLRSEKTKPNPKYLKTKHSFTKDQEDRIIHLYRWGYEPEEIREEMKASMTKIKNVLASHGKIKRIVDGSE
ncbi:MAG TPA: hypothetical protein VIH28_08325 [Ignavibacteriaceae bacterium]